jgi:hypothetical protein
MGMFDYIRCELPLPDGWQTDELQSKDFDCEMVTHVISKDGRLMLDRGHNEEVPLMERGAWKPEWGDSESAVEEHALEALMGCMRRVPKYIDANYHGVVNFYASETVGYEPPQPGDRFKRAITVWHEYNAKFTDGQLVSIELVPD